MLIVDGSAGQNGVLGSDPAIPAHQAIAGDATQNIAEALRRPAGRLSASTFTQIVAHIHPDCRRARICLTNNSAERALRGIALGGNSWLFAGSDRGGERAAAMYSLIVAAKLNDVDPRTWLADVLARIRDHPASKLDALLPWNWKSAPPNAAAA